MRWGFWTLDAYSSIANHKMYSYWISSLFLYSMVNRKHDLSSTCLIVRLLSWLYEVRFWFYLYRPFMCLNPDSEAIVHLFPLEPPFCFFSYSRSCYRLAAQLVSDPVSVLKFRFWLCCVPSIMCWHPDSEHHRYTFSIGAAILFFSRTHAAVTGWQR